MSRLATVLIAIGAALLATLAVSGPWAYTLHGLSFDSLVALRQTVFGPRHAPAQSPAVVIAIDEETYRRPPFESTPKVMWTRELATVIDAVMAADARVLGFDVILPTSVAGEIRGFDTPFLQALHRHAGEGRIVLGKVQHSLRPIVPAPGQRFAVGHDANMAIVNLYDGADGVVRGVPLAVPLVGPSGPTGLQLGFAADLARRAGGANIVVDSDGTVRREGVAVPTVAGNNLLIEFDDTQAGVLTYSLADLHACAAAGNAQFFRDHFAGKVVLLGSVLDVEDRKVTALRFAAAPDSAAFGERCVYPPMAGLLESDLARDTIPGVYVHAFAVNDLLRGEFLARPNAWAAAGLVAVAALLVGWAAAWLPAALALAVTAAAGAAWLGGAVALMQHQFATPFYEAPIAMVITLALTVVYRITVADRDKRLLRRMFGLYLAPAVVEQLVAAGEMPALGGETRELTVYFSDLAGFTAMAEGRGPDELVSHLNEYLTAMTETIEAHGGFVDKYIGDAIVAVFGAPHRDEDHAGNAVRAALECGTVLAALNVRWSGENRVPLRQRIGINTGPILVGNIGSRRRFNYTVMGDAVNLAARLEGANKVYGTAVLVSEATVQACRSGPRFGEIDTVRVVGRAAPIRIFTPLPLAEATRQADAYAAALDAYRCGNFAEAHTAWASLATTDPAAATMQSRAQRYAENPPPAWDGVYDLDAK